MTVRLDRVQQALYEALVGVADDVAWVHGEQPRGSGSLLTLELTAGPTRVHGQGVRGYLVVPAESVIVRVPSPPVVGARYVVELNGFAYRHDAEAGETAADIRTALLVAIAAGEAGIVTATPDSTDGILLTADALGGIRSLVLHGGLTHDEAVFSDDAIEVTEGIESMLVTLVAFSKEREPSTGAAAIIGAALARLRDRERVSELGRYGVSLWSRGAPQNLAAVRGAHWESQVAVDVTVAAPSVDIAPVEQIEAVRARVTVAGDTVEAAVAAP